MKKYRLITIKFGNGCINFSNGIIDLARVNEENAALEVMIEQSINNLSSLLEAGVAFVQVAESYRFYVDWSQLFGVDV